MQNTLRGRVPGQLVEFNTIDLLHIPQQGITIEYEVAEEGAFSKVTRRLLARQGFAQFRQGAGHSEYGDHVTFRDNQVGARGEALSVAEDASNRGVVRQL